MNLPLVDTVIDVKSDGGTFDIDHVAPLFVETMIPETPRGVTEVTKELANTAATTSPVFEQAMDCHFNA